MAVAIIFVPVTLFVAVAIIFTAVDATFYFSFDFCVFTKLLFTRLQKYPVRVQKQELFPVVVRQNRD